MAIVHFNKTVATSATLLTTLESITDYNAVSIQNNDSASIFLGDSSVTTSGANKGHVITTGATFQLWLHASNALYAISAAGTADNAVSVLYSQL